MSKNKQSSNSLSYKSAGVDIDAGNRLVDNIKPLVKSTRRKGADGEIGGFGGLFDLKATGLKDPILVAANDGVGTKLRIAIEAGVHDSIGIDLVAMCVNDIIVQGAEPLFFLDYFATGKLDVEQATNIIAGIANGCKQANCALLGGETAEMPSIYHGNDYDLAGFCVGAVERSAILPKSNIAQGDVLIALASSGAHSNGYSLIRKIVEISKIGWQETAPFDINQTLSQCLLTPTKIYVKSILSAFEKDLEIKALAHITGGGFLENIPRVLPDSVSAKIDLNKIVSLPVFGWLASVGEVEEKEMLRTFNCGVGMVLVVPEGSDIEIIEHFNSAGEKAYQIGNIIEKSDKKITFEGNLF